MSKVDSARQEIPDYDEVTSQIDWQQVPQVLGYADQVENGGHVLYHLAKHPEHIGAILNSPPSIAVSQIRRLSDSMKINRSGNNNEPMPNAPLGRLQASTAGVNTGKETLKDKKRRYTV